MRLCLRAMYLENKILTRRDGRLIDARSGRRGDALLTQSKCEMSLTGLSDSISVFPCQYHSTIAPYSFIHLPPKLYNVFLPARQFSPVSIIPPLLRTHSSIYHPHCIMFFSQHFSFPLSVPFHHCSILIHPSTTHAV